MLNRRLGSWWPMIPRLAAQRSSRTGLATQGANRLTPLCIGVLTHAVSVRHDQ